MYRNMKKKIDKLNKINCYLNLIKIIRKKNDKFIRKSYFIGLVKLLVLFYKFNYVIIYLYHLRIINYNSYYESTS